MHSSLQTMNMNNYNSEKQMEESIQVKLFVIGFLTFVYIVLNYLHF